MAGALRHVCTVCLIATFLFAGSAQAQDDIASGPRERILAASLLDTTPRRLDMVHNDHFMPVAPYGDALHDFSGLLVVSETVAQPVDGRFPGFSIAFFSHDGFLIPVERDIVSGGPGKWDLIFSPGRVWSEESDGGWSRASFPFALVGKVWGNVHNGIATFLYNDSEVSGLRFQIVQESSPTGQFDGRAHLPMTYLPGPVANREAIVEGFKRHRAAAPDMESFEALEGMVDPLLLAEFNGPAENITVSALVADGVIYASPCHTRHGNFPYCSEMRHGVYSVTKSLAAALTLLHLAQRYGDDILDQKIVDLLDVTADHDGWDEVTFADAINMTTGIGENAPGREPIWAGFMADEGGMHRSKVATAPSVKAMLDVTFSAPDYPWEPGEVPRYNSTHTIVLAAAMDALIKDREGTDVDLWTMTVGDALESIGIQDAPLMHWNDPELGKGPPIMGWGYLPTIGEIAMIATLLQSGGSYEGKQLLSPTLLEAFLQTSAEPGLPIDWENAFGRYRYHASFWMMPFQTDNGCSFWIPEMIGTGGNVIALLPNGMTVIRLADAYEGSPGQYEAEGMARVANDLEPFCP